MKKIILVFTLFFSSYLVTAQTYTWSPQFFSEDQSVSLTVSNFDPQAEWIVESDVLGIVGSGYNNWGETPDFSLTEIQPDVYVGDIVTLVDGEIKFRVNNAWDTDYGDNGLDGTLELGGANIPVQAGLYRVELDLSTNQYALNKVQ